MSSAKLALHATALYLAYQAFDTLLYKRQSIINESYGSHFQFLTILGLVAATLAQFLGLLSVLTSSRTLQKLHNFVNIVAAPIELLIAVLYWSIRAKDPTLVVDPRFGLVPSFWLDIRLHLFPAIYELVDVLAFTQPWKTSTAAAFLVYSTCGLGYWVWIHHTFEMNGYYPYPLFELVSVEQRVAIFAGATALITVMFRVIKSLQGLQQQ